MLRRILGLLLLVSALPLAAFATGDETGEMTGSYWYAFDNVTVVETAAHIMVWATVPPAWHGQEVNLGTIEPEPVALVKDPASGNTVVEWAFDPVAFRMHPDEESRHFFFHYDFTVRPRPVDVSLASGGDYDRQDPLYRRFTAAETLLQVDGSVRDQARRLVEGLDSPVLRARAIFDWIVAEFTFTPGGQGARDARSVLSARKGDCEQYAILFSAMCRSLGIPARTVTAVWPSGQVHVFAEFLTPAGAWVPVDPSLAQLMRPQGGGIDPAREEAVLAALGLTRGEPGDMFGRLYDQRVIVTLGNNISFNSPTLKRRMEFKRMRPGGDAASPMAMASAGLNKGVVSGGFFVMGDQPVDEASAHDLVHLKLADRYFAPYLEAAGEPGCRSALATPLSDDEAWLDMGRVHMHKREFYLAEAAFRRALKSPRGPTRAWAHNYLGNCYDMLGHRDLALEQYLLGEHSADGFPAAMKYARKYQDHTFTMVPEAALGR